MGFLPIDTREALHLNDLHSRATCYRRNYGYYTCRSGWSRFGRWILAGVLILIGLVFLFAFMCITRKRRRRNQIKSSNQPMAYTQPTNTNTNTYGQAPVSNTYNQQPAQDYNYSQPQQSYAPPAGAPPMYGGGGAHVGANQDYYGTSGVTQPANTYAK
ncbi:hypothetical protein SBOR_9863 [Sclerotinia borealis F-4128]|uniref:Chitin synthesis regulation, Congo red resistance, RCR protein n=1 Tax=Sclerotinia borealis (strain F-4128) TaxID=1432307 RepID=W9C5A1_SCLBF|nr:hypothetical protein SBOR_9863 [Sclerotinia borealis F-4128]